MSRSAARKTASRTSVSGSPLPKTPAWLVCACFFTLTLVGIFAACFLLLSGIATDGASVRLLVWCAVEVAACVASGILFSKEKNRRRWFSVCVYVLAAVSLLRIVVPLALTLSALSATVE